MTGILFFNMNTKPSLLKQALGALAGAGVALAVYGIYSISAPHIQAYVLTPQSWLPERSEEDVAFNDENVDPEVAKRIVARTKEIMAANTEPQDSRYMDDGQAIRRYPVEGAVRVAARATSSAASSAHTAAPISEPPSQEEVQNRWDNLQPEGGTPMVNESTPQPEIPAYIPPPTPPVVASVSEMPQTPPNLSSSGLGLTAILGAAFGGALVRRRKNSKH